MELLTLENIVKYSNISGVYRIQIKNHFYIGSTSNFKRRLAQHLKTLVNGTHHNHTMQNCYCKYGADNLMFEIVEICKKEDCIVKEKYYIDTLHPDINHILDPITLTRDSIFRKRISDSKKNWFKYNKPINCKKVYKYDLYGTYIEEFISATEAAESVKGNVSAIVACCKGRSLTAYKHQWSYTKTDMPCFAKKKKDNKTKEKVPIVSPFRKPVYQYDYDGNFIASYSCAGEASENTGINQRAIALASIDSCKAYKSAGGYQWRYYKADLIEPYINNSDKARNVHIEVFDCFSNTTCEYESIASFVRTHISTDNFSSECATVSSCITKNYLYKSRFKIKKLNP